MEYVACGCTIIGLILFSKMLMIHFDTRFNSLQIQIDNIKRKSEKYEQNYQVIDPTKQDTLYNLGAILVKKIYNNEIIQSKICKFIEDQDF